MFFVSFFFFFPFLFYSSSQKVLGDQILPETGTNPLYIKWATLCWNYKRCSKSLFTFQNLRELNKGLCSHLSHCIIKIVKTYFSAWRLLSSPQVRIWLLFIFTMQMLAAPSWVPEGEYTSSILLLMSLLRLAEYLCTNMKDSQPPL